MQDNSISTNSGRRVVTVNVDGEVYGLPIEIVEGIVPWETMTRVPRMPKFMAGLVTIRGSVLAVVDLRTRLGLHDLDHTPQNRIVIVHFNETRIGFIVDSVKEVTWIPDNVIEHANELISSADEKFLEGVAKLDSGLVILLNIEHLLSHKEQTDLSRVKDKAASKAA